MPTLYIYCGIPGSGKSYYAQNIQKDVPYLSRDAIRFSMVKEDEEYFSKEPKVFNCFSASAAAALIVGSDVICDATHISKGSRRKLIDAIDRYFEKNKEEPNYDIVFVVFDTPFEVCCERNAARIGRARVPDNVMESFRNGWLAPSMKEDKRVKKVEWVKGE